MSATSHSQSATPLVHAVSYLRYFRARLVFRAEIARRAREHARFERVLERPVEAVVRGVEAAVRDERADGRVLVRHAPAQERGLLALPIDRAAAAAAGREQEEERARAREREREAAAQPLGAVRGAVRDARRHDIAERAERDGAERERRDDPRRARAGVGARRRGRARAGEQLRWGLVSAFELLRCGFVFSFRGTRRRVLDVRRGRARAGLLRWGRVVSFRGTRRRFGDPVVSGRRVEAERGK